jgi:hypothetical protein
MKYSINMQNLNERTSLKNLEIELSITEKDLLVINNDLNIKNNNKKDIGDKNALYEENIKLQE